MIKRSFLLLSIFGFGFCSYAQNERNMIDVLNIKQEVCLLDKKIIGLMKKDSFFSNTQEFQLFHVFWLNYQDVFRKEDFLNNSFLEKLCPIFFIQKSLCKNKRTLQAETFICDSLGHLVATSNGLFIYSAIKHNVNFSKNDIELLSLFYNKKIDFAFYIGFTPIGTSFCLKNNDVFVVQSLNKDLIIYSMGEFVKTCWDDFVNPSIFSSYKKWPK